MQKKRIYTIAASHLDTSWLWDLETSILEYIPATLNDNFRLFERYPDYRFGFEGSYRYELMEEYYPEEFKKLKEYVKAGKWYPTGSSYENGDVNTPSPESLLRNILYGSQYFESKFGTASNDIFLPDCFGFGWALPSIMRHCNLKGFSTGKLAWGSAYGTPFDIGRWFGVDGSWVYGNVNPGSYSRNLKNVRENGDIAPKLAENTEKYGLPLTAAFYGIGDRGGAPADSSVQVVTDEIKANPSSDTDVLSVTSNELFERLDSELSDEQKSKLPTWNNELVMENHGVGSYTSRAVGKRWNKACERLADMAERACSAAEMTGLYSYPRNVLDTAWKRFIAHQFHDDITGTSFQTCYRRNWNDYILSQKQFEQEYGGALSAIASSLATDWVKGTPVAVSNTLQYARREAVTARVCLPQGTRYVRVCDSNGEVPSQILSEADGKFDVCFVADMAGFEVKMFDVSPADEPCEIKTGVSADCTHIENAKIKADIDAQGNICTITDKVTGEQLLSDKIHLAVFDYKGSKSWPAWELTYKELCEKPTRFVTGAKVRVITCGCAAAQLEVTGSLDGSSVRQIISLDAGSDTVRVFNEVDWRCAASLLKVVFPLSQSNGETSYDLGLGYIKRGNSREKLYEMPAQLWSDVTGKNCKYGVSVFSDSRAGWDKPDDCTLRLTAMHTPYYAYRWECSQHLMDMGLNRFSFGVHGHKGAVGSDTQRAAQCFNTPLTCVVGENMPAKAGSSSFAYASISNSSVIVRAIKKSQQGNSYTVRFNEGEGIAKQNVRFSLPVAIDGASEVYATEKYKGEARVEDGCLVFDIGAFGIKSFELTVAAKQAEPAAYEIIPLKYNTRVSAKRGESSAQPCVPEELMPGKITCGGVPFEFGSGELNAVCCKGQTLLMPKGGKKLHLLVWSNNRDRKVVFIADGKPIIINVPDRFEHVGAWDLVGMGETGYIKKERLAYCITHTRENGKDVPAKQIYVFELILDCREELLLPNDVNVTVLAATAQLGSGFTQRISQIDKLDRREFDYVLSKDDLKRSRPSSSEQAAAAFLGRKKTVKIHLPMINGVFQWGDIFGLVRSLRNWLK